MEEFEVPPPKETLLQAATPAICLILFIVILYWNACRNSNYTEKNGVVTVAKAIETRIDSDVLIHIYYKGKIIAAVVSTECYFCIDRYYFVKIRKDDPGDHPLFYEDKSVPDCIIENVKYFNGWNDFPTCDSLK